MAHHIAKNLHLKKYPANVFVGVQFLFCFVFSCSFCSCSLLLYEEWGLEILYFINAVLRGESLNNLTIFRNLSRNLSKKTS